MEQGPPKNKEDLHLYYNLACPYSQRVRIFLRLKGLDFSESEIDLSQERPPWFLALNPKGTTPVLEHNDRVLIESSSAMNEYLEDVFINLPAFPITKYEKALARIMIDFCGHTFCQTFMHLFKEQDHVLAGKRTEEHLESYKWLNEFLKRHNPNGTWALGDEFGAVDAAFAPFLLRDDILNGYYRHFSVPDALGYHRVLKWRKACEGHPLVRNTSMGAEDLIKVFYDMSLGKEKKPGERSSWDLAWSFKERPMPPRGELPAPHA